MKQITSQAPVQINQHQALGEDSSTTNRRSKRQNAMLNKFHFTFHLRTEGISDKEFPFIYAKVILNGNRVNLGSTGIRVRKEDWDARSRRSKRKDVPSQTGNDTLDAIESQVRSIFLLFEAERKLLTPAELKKRMHPEYTEQKYVPLLIKLYLDESLQLCQHGHVAKLTHKTRKEKLARFQRFLESERRFDKLLVTEIKGFVLERYKNWMLKRGAKESYAQKCQQFAKTFVLWCYHNGHIDINPLDNYRVHVDKTPILEHLSESELHSLITTTFPKRLQETVDCYLFACHTGLAYVDIKGLTSDNIVLEEGQEFLYGRRSKTDTEFFVPLVPLAKKLIEKYDGIDRLPLRSNKEVNMMLKVAMAQIGVARRIWFHTARKTFTHRMQNIEMYSDETTAAMIGHKSTRELKYYRSITKQRVLTEVLKKRS